MKQGRLSTVVKRVRGKRDWVKNAIIVFLALMLVLTFFSNTIMNYSLPEVAAQYPQSTTITTKVRGSGTVEAAQSYNVTVQETRTVSAVNVKVGDTVKAGDTLLTLDETDSQELIAARSAYNALKLEYDKMLVDQGNQSHASEAALQQARDAVSSAETDLANAREYESDLAWYQTQEANAKSALNSKTQAKEAAQAKVDNLTGAATEESVKNSNAEYLDAVNQVQTLTDIGANMEDHSRYADYLAALNERDRLYREQIAPKLAELTQQLEDAKQALVDATTAESQASSAYTSAQDALAQFQTENANAMTVAAAEDALEAARNALSTAEATAADTEAQQTYDDAVAKLDLEAKAQEVAAAEEKVRQLEEKTAAAKIVSRYAGVVQTINVAAGDTTSAETPLMVVELTEKGYTLNATVTKEQARLLQEGLTAEITNIWESGITMTLTSITADQSDPANSRKLTFTVQGDNVTVGQTLNFSIGNKNSSFDVVIPSAAVHTDADGSFVYTVTVRSSPLGNRYTVKKTAVEVLASDDINSAVSGELSTAEFVITTATVPLQPGDQVRIAE